MGKKFGFSFSWRRALGISAAKGRISRMTGVPLTRSGMERKIGRAVLRVGLPLLIAGFVIVAAFFKDALKPEPEASLPEPEPKTIAPTPAPAVLISKVSRPPLPTSKTTEEAKQLAVKYHPELGVSGSPLNTEFVARHKRYQAENPAFFNNPSWPIALVEECVQSMRAK
jgi:hypothetical protein